MSFDRGLVTALAEIAPAIPRGIIVGSYQLPGSWWEVRDQPGGSAAVSALLDSAAAGMAFVALEVALLEAASSWRAQNASTPLFTWTVRTEADRAAAARWADAPIFEGYEP
jgi:hypothetical protein